MEQVKAHDQKLEAMTAGIQPVLDCVGLEQPEGARPAWVDFKEFTRSATHGAVVHAVAYLRSHYPSVDL